MSPESTEEQRKRPWIRDHAWQVAKFTTGLVFALFTAWFVLADPEDRQLARIARNWAVVHEMRGAQGNEGQIAALQALYLDGATLWHLNQAGAFFRGLRIPGADLTASTFTDADLRDADLIGATLTVRIFRAPISRGRILVGQSWAAPISRPRIFASPAT
jgi:hypothetical protein